MFVSEQYSATIRQPFGRRSLLAVQRGVTFAVRNDSDTIVRVDADGVGSSIALQSLPPSGTPDDEAIHRANEDVIAQYSDRRDRDAAARLLSEMPKPRRMPRLSQFVSDERNGLWVALPSGSATRTWLHYDESGAPRFRIELPPEFVLLIAGDDRFVGFTRTASGEERVLSIAVLPH